mmetsp:Transcript_8368/g.25137  ORF Transcript_8368/g.25137 Transcript_8368/m.25137 type:complete len:244 (+) Transcript_8368:283-1014(+)
MASEATADTAVSRSPKSSRPLSSPSPCANVRSTNNPSHVSTSAMPLVNRSGRIITATDGTPFGPTAASASSPTSDAVSKPMPNSTPTKNIFQAASMDASSRWQQPQRVRKPVISTRAGAASPSSTTAAACECVWMTPSCACSCAAWLSPVRTARRHARNCGPTVARLKAPTASSVTEENTALTTAPVEATASTFSRTSAEPPATMAQSSTTMDEWPRLNQRPTSAAGLPAYASLRATLSIAAI